MALQNELVQIAPKVLCWYGLPVLLSEAQRFRLLLHDIYLHSATGGEIDAFPQLNGRTTAYVYSFDHYAPTLRAHSEHLQVAAARKLADYINTFCSHNSVVVTRTLSPRVEEVCLCLTSHPLLPRCSSPRTDQTGSQKRLVQVPTR